MPPTKPENVGPLDAVAFLCELAMVILLVVAGHGIVGGWLGWALGVFLAMVAIGIWAQWMAPMSPRRLDNPLRLAVQIMLFITVALYAAAGALTWWGIGFAVVAIATFAARRVTDP
ncbi:YrdB family protein [Aeromicrobium sp. CTD01-1L150]|uniref:YrdB family protein n=1 Tax=Aeromicrobium sp. CTD01-1L150 TaxID=3341830 RepID=UPI0035C059D8